MILPLVALLLLQNNAPLDDSVYYANAEPGIRYVGSKPCAACHGEIYDSYTKTEMGRSMTAMSAVNIIERFPQSKAVYDTARNFYYEMLARKGKFYQREFRKGKKGEIVH